jgi:hypothetical protein
MKHLNASLPVILPIILAWSEKQQIIILESGVPLDEAQLADARRAGVSHPDKIRLLQVEVIPQASDEEVRFIARQLGIHDPQARALTFGYGISIRRDHWDNRYTLVHEFVHVAQHEEMNGLRPFISEHLRQCIQPGYPFGHLEQTAIHIAKDICREG